MGTNQYLLEWNQHLENFAENFSSLRDQAEYVDCSLACEDGIVGAHRIILAGCSTYFQQLFARAHNPHPIIFLTNTSRSLVILLMEFIYRGKTYVPQDKLPTLLELGRQLRIKGLVRVNTPSVDSLGSTMVTETVSNGNVDLQDIDFGNQVHSDSSVASDDEAQGKALHVKHEKLCFSEVSAESADPVEDGVLKTDGSRSEVYPSITKKRGRPKLNKQISVKGSKRENLLTRPQKDGYSLSPLDILILGAYAVKYGPEDAIKFARKRHKRNFRLSTIGRYAELYNLCEVKKKEKIESKLLSIVE